MQLRLLSLVFLLALLACEKPKVVPPSEGRTVLVYMIANTNLNRNAIADINEMEQSWDDHFVGRLYVLLNTMNNENYLYCIGRDNDLTKITSKIVKTYSATEDACDTKFFRSVVDDVRSIAPAKSYGLVMWGHGKGWIPRGSQAPLPTAVVPGSKSGYAELTDPESNVLTGGASYTFGSTYNGSLEMETYDMAKALQGLHFDYMYFDACHMACVESIYELRGVTDYVAASVSETWADGSPYNQTVRDMFTANSKEAIVEMARKFYDYYDVQSGIDRSATISVTDTRYLQAMAVALKAVVTKNPTISLSTIQQFGREQRGLNLKNTFFDLSDFATKTWETSNASGVATFKTALNNAVVYQAATPGLFGSITVNTHCGLAAYIPRSTQPATLSVFRTKYTWSQDSGLANMVD